MTTHVALGLSCLLLAIAAVSGVAQKTQRALPKPIPIPVTPTGTNKMELGVVPQNTAVLDGDTVILTCSSTTPSPISRIQWFDYVTGTARQISDNAIIAPGHPSVGRLAIIQDPDIQTFNLQISSVQFADGGTYACLDANGDIGAQWRFQAELIVFTDEMNCTTYVPDNGYVIEEQEYTNQCIMTFQGGMVPEVDWMGPDVSRCVTASTDTQVFSGCAFLIDRSMTTQSYIVEAYFNELDFSRDQPPAGVAGNAPEIRFLHAYGQLFVYWGPKSMYYEPVQAYYRVGDTITCWADALPVPFYMFWDMGTLDQFAVQTLQIPATMHDRTIQLRCRAQNLIQGYTYEGNFLWFIDVHDDPTTPTTTPAPSTTTAPAQSSCNDLTGWWASTNPKFEMNVMLDDDDTTSGNMIGFYRVEHDQYWVEQAGRTRVADFAYLGLTAILAGTDGVLGFSCECHRCFGIETLIVDTIWRSVADSAFCGDGGTPAQDMSVNLTRAIGPAPSEPYPADFKVYNPTPQISGKILGLHKLQDHTFDVTQLRKKK